MLLFIRVSLVAIVYGQHMAIHINYCYSHSRPSVPMRKYISSAAQTPIISITIRHQPLIPYSPIVQNDNNIPELSFGRESFLDPACLFPDTAHHRDYISGSHRTTIGNTESGHTTTLKLNRAVTMKYAGNSNSTETARSDVQSVRSNYPRRCTP